MIIRRIDIILAAAVLASTLTGCWGVGEDLSDCYRRGNATLTFHYTNDAGQDIFTRDIGSVDAFIFDDQNCLVAHGRFDRTALDSFRGWKLTLPAGDYRAVCWANVESNSGFSPLTPGVTTFDQCYVEIDRSAAATGDRIFYAPRKTDSGSRAGAPFGAHGSRAAEIGDMADYEFTVAPGQPVVKQMRFVRAYRTLNVYVKGFSDGGRQPVIEVSNLLGSYDFLFGALGGKCDFRQDAQAVTTGDGPAALASFHHAFGDVQDDVAITARKASDNSAVCRINLKEFIDLNPAALKDDIDVLIEFSDLGVVIGVPGWNDKPIAPEI